MGEPYCHFEFEIDDSGDNYQISVLDILGKVKKKRVQSNLTNGSEAGSALPEVANDALSKIAANLEKKYGQVLSVSDNHKKRRIRVNDYKRYHLDYDVEDTFIDDSEFVDDVLDPDVTTTVGGFYVNCGDAEGVIDHDFDAKLRAKWQMDDSLSNHSLDTNGDKSISNPSPPESPCKASSQPSPLVKPESAVASRQPSPSTTTSVPVVPAIPQPTNSQIKSDTDQETPKTITPPSSVPDFVSAELLSVIEKLKARSEVKDVSVRAFFDSQTSVHLLELDRLMNASQLSKSQKVLVYTYLEHFVPTKRQAMIKKIKGLKEDRCQKALNPWIKALETEVNNTMPQAKEMYAKEMKIFEDRFENWKIEHTKYLAEQSANSSSLDSSLSSIMETVNGESDSRTPSSASVVPFSLKRPVKPNTPRRNFQWSPNAKMIFEKILNIKLEALQQLRCKGSDEDNLKKFFDESLVPLWPKGWMSALILWRKAVPILGSLKQLEPAPPCSAAVPHPVDSVSSEKVATASPHKTTVPPASNTVPISQETMKPPPEPQVIAAAINPEPSQPKRIPPKPSTEENVVKIPPPHEIKDASSEKVSEKVADNCNSIFSHLDDIISSVLCPASTTVATVTPTPSSAIKVPTPVAIPGHGSQSLQRNTSNKVKRKASDTEVLNEMKLKKTKMAPPQDIVSNGHNKGRIFPLLPPQQNNGGSTENNNKIKKYKRSASSEAPRESTQNTNHNNNASVTTTFPTGLASSTPTSSSETTRPSAIPKMDGIRTSQPSASSLMMNGSGSLPGIQTAFSHTPPKCVITSPEVPRYDYGGSPLERGVHFRHPASTESSSFPTMTTPSKSVTTSQAAQSGFSHFSPGGLLPSLENFMSRSPTSSSSNSNTATSQHGHRGAPTASVAPLQLHLASLPSVNVTPSHLPPQASPQPTMQSATISMPQSSTYNNLAYSAQSGQSQLARFLSLEQQQQYGAYYSQLSEAANLVANNANCFGAAYDFVNQRKNKPPTQDSGSNNYAGQYSYQGRYPPM